MPQHTLSQERHTIDPSKYEKYSDLPLVSTGCDSYAAWDERFKHLSPFMTIEEIVDHIINLLPNNRFNIDKHLILTGGEPLLGWQKAYPNLLSKLQEHGLTHLTFETNGTQKLHDDLYEFLRASKISTTFSISSKLPSSGEKWEDAIKPDVVDQYCVLPGSINYFKWVVSDPLDIEDIIRAYNEYQATGITLPVYLMPAGGITEVYNKNKRWVADLAKNYGFRFSPRLQVELYKNAWGT